MGISMNPILILNKLKGIASSLQIGVALTEASQRNGTIDLVTYSTAVPAICQAEKDAFLLIQKMIAEIEPEVVSQDAEEVKDEVTDKADASDPVCE